ncbi:unnamed protein product [Cuscuta campestris]|uniref:Uncharacterized protein n=1 Tax=Cuscuta campestris TaxID=132261 RepID=A0A484N2Q5_9ASTE|nr:unnamed protein product [Cuscuta campestris]
MQFLDSPVDKLDDWFRRFFVVVVPEDLPFPNMWRKKEDKFPSHLFPPRDSKLEGVFRLLRKNGHLVPRALLLKDSYFRGLGYWVSPDIPLQEPSGNTTSSWVPPFRVTRTRRASRRSSRRDPSPEEDTEGEETESVTGAQPLSLVERPPFSGEVVVQDVSDEDGLYDFSPGTLRGPHLIPGVPHLPLFGRGTSSSAQPRGPLGFHPQTGGTLPTGRATGSQGSLEPPHVQVAGLGFRAALNLLGNIPPPLAETGSSSSSQVRHKRGRNSTPLPGSLVSAGPPMGTADDEFLIGQGSQPFPYAREAYQFTGYTSWVGRDFNNKLQEIQQLKRDHPDVVHSPAWPFMQEEYTRMRHSLRLLDRNAALSKELRDFKSRHSICVERPEYDRVLSENDQLHSDRERLAAKIGLLGRGLITKDPPNTFGSPKLEAQVLKG